VKLEVIDSGPAMKQEDLERIFDRFYTTKQGGLGMGLPISRSIVQTHGGKMWATPNADRGLTMQVAIPKECEVSRERK
jgi:signal transduction histidine kinase